MRYCQEIDISKVIECIGGPKKIQKVNKRENGI